MADKVFINGRAAVHAGSIGKSIAFPDVCLCPPGPPSGPVPTPLTNTAKAADLDGCAATVTIEGNRMAHAQSFVARSTGDEVARSTGGGIITHTTQGKAYFQTFSMDVMVEGQPAVRHLDLLTHNHMARVPGNTPPAPWMSKMLAGPGAAPKQVEKDAREGKEWIEFVLMDIFGSPAGAVICGMQTPAGKKLEVRVPSGGVLRVSRLAKGNCNVTFPRLDDGSHGAETVPGDKIPKAVASPGKRSKADKLYRPGTPLSLATGKRYSIELPLRPSYWLAVPKGRKRHKDEQITSYTLVSSDGAYSVTRALTDHIRRGRDVSMLEFPDLDPDLSYSLFMAVDKGEKHPVFVKRSWTDMTAGKVQSTKTKKPKSTATMDLRDSIRQGHAALLQRHGRLWNSEEPIIDPGTEIDGDDE